MKDKLNLFSVAANEMKETKAGAVQNPGDGSCGCSCYYAGSGGSSTRDNGLANCDHGLYSEKGNIIWKSTPPVIIYGDKIDATVE